MFLITKNQHIQLLKKNKLKRLSISKAENINQNELLKKQ